MKRGPGNVPEREDELYERGVYRCLERGSRGRLKRIYNRRFTLVGTCGINFKGYKAT